MDLFHHKAIVMKQQKSAHEIVSHLIKIKRYSFKQLSEFYGLSPSTLHAMLSNEHYREAAETRDLLNSKKPTDKPRWA